MTIKSFRGLIADGTQDSIILHTNDGSTGYRIKKFQVIQNTPGTGQSVEACMKIYKVQQTTIDNVVDFSDQTLLGVAYYQDNNGTAENSTLDVIFDGEIFNQDIFITHVDSDGAVPMNYYLELEQIKLDLNENTVATLRDLRNETLTV
jgi:archaellum component FlaF (FlaF/FlaG flagellin family)